MPSRNYYFYALLFVLTLLPDLQISAKSTIQRTGRSVSPDLSAIAEGGPLQKTDNDVLNKKNTTLPKTLNVTNGPSNDGVLIQVNKTLNITKQIEKPLITEKTIEINFDHTPLPVVKITPKVEQTQKHMPTKPQITEHDDDPGKPIIPEPEAYLPNMSNIDALKKKNTRANYVIPIVAVILSIPLVAIIISVVYKRGADWWQHRNYRRMDFLIEGMYNT